MASPDEFSRTMARIATKVEDNTSKAIRKAALVADQVAVLATPVDTGRARSNWIVSVDVPSSVQVGPLDKTGAAALAKGAAAIASFNAGTNRSIFLANNVPYIAALDAGSSRQAPNGMTAKAVQAARRSLQGARLLD